MNEIAASAAGGEKRLRRYHVHPSFGLRVLEEQAQHPTLPYQALPEEWRGRDCDYQDAVESAYFREILVWLSIEKNVRFEIELPFPGETERVLDAAREHGLDLVDLGQRVLEGMLASALINVLVTTNPVLFVVSVDGTTRLALHDGWTGVVLHLAEEEVSEISGLHMVQ